MKIRIYQISLERDSDKVAFMALDTLQKLQKTEGVNSSLYDRVYEADVDCFNLEDVFKLFNLNHPADFTGHSLSVSDVVEVVDSGVVLLGHQLAGTDDEGAGLIGFLAHADRTDASYGNGQDDTREESDVAQRHQRQVLVEGDLVDGLFVAVVFSDEREGILCI